jgi:hypothetical protein
LRRVHWQGVDGHAIAPGQPQSGIAADQDRHGGVGLKDDRAGTAMLAPPERVRASLAVGLSTKIERAGPGFPMPPVRLWIQPDPATVTGAPAPGPQASGGIVREEDRAMIWQRLGRDSEDAQHTVAEPGGSGLRL